METENLITLEQFCSVYEVNDSFVLSLQEFGLIEVITVEKKQYLNALHLKKIESIMRLHYDLNINMEGIDTITILLGKIQALQQELKETRNRLLFYEDPQNPE